jgi:hypothetical protein
MPLTIPEMLSDAPAGVALFNQVKDAIEAMPPAAERKAVDYAKAFGATADGPLMKLAELFDTVEAQIAS